MPGESAKKQRKNDPAPPEQNQGGHEQATPTPSRQQSPSSSEHEGRGTPRSLGQRGTRQQGVDSSQRDFGQRKEGGQDSQGASTGDDQNSEEIGGPGPHGSYDPETEERNKNKPLTDDWGKSDKH